MKFAIIGCGRIAQRHAAHIVKNGSLVAVCDIIRERADSLAEQYGAAAWYAIEDLLKSGSDIDVISVCTPNGLHAVHSIQSLNAGYHVLCEKPMAINVQDCGEMIKAAERANKRLFIVKQNRYNPPIEKVKALIDEGILGRSILFS